MSRSLPAHDPDGLVLHVGPPRTGTTSLQFGVFSQHPQIETLGKPYAVPGVEYPACRAMAELCQSIWQEDGVAFDWTHARELCAAALARPSRSGAVVRVVSEEGFGHGGATDRELIAGRLRRIFGRCRVLMTVRDPIEATASYYSWAFSRGLAAGSIDSWVRACTAPNHYFGRPQDYPLKNARYGELATTYARLFGADKLCLLPLELLRRDRKAYATRLATFLGVEPAPTSRLLEAAALNASPRRLDARYQRMVKSLQRLRSAAGSPERITPSALATDGVHALARGLLKPFDRPMRRMSKETRRWLECYYGPDQELLLRCLEGQERKLVDRSRERDSRG